MLSKPTLSILLPLYGFIASTLPVWVLLCPRDYLSSYMKLGTIGLLVVGIFVVNPTIHMPAVTQYVHGGGPIIPGKVWPFVCITIACGAISGFHSLIGSGTTPKMIRKRGGHPLHRLRRHAHRGGRLDHGPDRGHGAAAGRLFRDQPDAGGVQPSWA